jgi:prephenate dehydrogenase
LSMMMDILTTNRQPVLIALRRFEERLARIEECLEHEDWEQLRSILEQGALNYEALMAVGR